MSSRLRQFDMIIGSSSNKGFLSVKNREISPLVLSCPVVVAIEATSQISPLSL